MQAMRASDTANYERLQRPSTCLRLAMRLLARKPACAPASLARQPASRASQPVSPAGLSAYPVASGQLLNLAVRMGRPTSSELRLEWKLALRSPAHENG